MSIFTSKRPEDFDPRPYVGVSIGRVTRYAHNDDNDPGIAYDPRPHFQPTRDTHPWVDPFSGARYELGYRDRFVWAPRPEFKTPDNPILAALRQEVELQREADWLSLPTIAELTLAGQIGFEDATDAERDHATRVLSRLVAL